MFLLFATPLLCGYLLFQTINAKPFRPLFLIVPISVIIGTLYIHMTTFDFPEQWKLTTATGAGMLVFLGILLVDQPKR